MLRLAILRHADAVPLTDEGDAERELSPGGRAMAERMGRYFREAGLRPDLVLVSTSKRTRETFEALERGAGETFAVDYVPSLYSANLLTLEDAIAETPADAKFLLIVGHNPGVAELANILTGEGKKADLAQMRGYFPTPCLALIDFDAKSWPEIKRGQGRLECFITPRNALNK